MRKAMEFLVRRKLRSGIRRRRQTEKIPERQEQDSDQLGQRRRNVNERAAEHAAYRRSDKSKKSVNPSGRAAATGRDALREKRRQQRLVKAIAEEECRATEIQQNIIVHAKEVGQKII